MKKTETLLRTLFDYQRFEPNARLSSLIAESEKRQNGELSDDDLSRVAAAGEPELNELRKTELK
ncbi:MAG: hypothetical protein KBS45_00350 [Clostridiales bacterium]|nr:hypothetical protein [Candidatus Coliplasma caballi]